MSFLWAALYLFSSALQAETAPDATSEVEDVLDAFAIEEEAAAARVMLRGTLTLTPHTADPGPGNEAWTLTYTEPGWATTVTGIIIKPIGAGPFPAVIASHGKGGHADPFGMQKGKDWFAPNGFITIAVEYTHAGQIYCIDEVNQCAGTAENVRRGNRAYQLLRSQDLINEIGDVVAGDSIMLYGNSLGALLTIELAQILGSSARSVAITAGGIYLEGPFAYMTPNGADGIADIYAPFMHLHGRYDQVIPEGRQNDLSDALDLNDKTHQQVWFPDGGHNIARVQMTEGQVRDFIVAWFFVSLDRTTPRIISFSITSGQAGDTVDITGRNFGSNVNSNSVVNFGGVPAEIVSWSNTSITVIVPIGAVTGSVEVVVPVGPITDPIIEQPVAGGVRSKPKIFTIL